MGTSENDIRSASGIPGDVKIKTENRITAPLRLASFKKTRDLSLSNSNKQAPKKVFTPNLNVTRNKNKNPSLNDINKDRKKQAGHNGRDRHRGPGGHNKTSSVLKSTGVFSEGIAATNTRRYNTRESYSLGNSREPSVLSKPVLKIKSEKKFDKEFEDLQIKEFLSDDDSNDVPMDNIFLPIGLPMNLNEGFFLKNTEKLTIKQEPIIKTEPVDIPKVEISSEPQIETKHKIKTEPIDGADVMNFFQDSKPSLFMLQFPDCLPGRGPDNCKSLDDKNKDPKGDEKESDQYADNTCRFEHLDEGQIGKIVVHKSGKIKLIIGNTHYDLNLGSQTCFRQDVMSISVDTEQRSGKMINLGNIQTKITAIPDWERMFNEYDNS